MDNEYQRFLENQQQKQKEQTGFGELAALGAGIAAVGLGLGTSQGRALIREAGAFASDTGTGAWNRIRQTQIGSKLRDAGTIIKAMDYADDGRSLVSHMRNPNRYRDRFEESLTRSIDKRNRAMQTPLGDMPTLGEKAVYRLTDDMRMIRNRVEREIRYEKVKGDLQGKFSDDVFKNLHGILNQHGNTKFFKKASRQEVDDLLSHYSQNKSVTNSAHQLKFNDDTDKENFLNKVMSSIDAHRDLSRGDKKEINRITKDRTREMFDSLMTDLGKPKNAATKAMEMQGKRHVTWKDAFERGLLDKDSMRRPVRGGTHRDANTGKIMENLNRALGGKLDDLILDPHLFMDRGGKLHDYRGFNQGFNDTMDFIKDNFEVPFLRFNPLDLMHWTTYQSVREAPRSYVFNRGNIDVTLSTVAKTLERHPMDHMQDAAANPLDRSYIYSGGKVRDLLSGEVIKDDVYLASARFGMMPRVMAGVGNLHRQDYRNVNPIKRMFGFGMQEQESIYQRMASGLTKFADDDWGPNAVSRLMRSRFVQDREQRAQIATEVFKKLHSDLDTRSLALSDDVAKALDNATATAYGDLGIRLTKLNTDEEIMDALAKIADNMTTGKTNDSRDLSGMIHSMVNQYRDNPQEFVASERILSDATPITAGIVDMSDMSETRLISAVEDARRLVHQHALKQIEQTTPTDARGIIQGAIRRGELNASALNEVADLQALSSLRGHWENIYNGSKFSSQQEAMNFAEKMWRQGDDALSVVQSVQRHSPSWALGPGDVPPQYFGRVGYLAVNKAKGGRHALQQYNEMIQQGISPTKAGIKSAGEIIGQAFAGRKNIDNVTTATMPFYYFAERLDNALSRVGLGLPQNMRGSMQGILGNQMLRRIVMPYVAYQQAMYVDGMFGDVFSDQLADTYVNMHQDTAFFKDITGINAIGKHLSSLMPGSELFWETPIGSVAKHGSFGFFGDTRSAEEVEQYYESGEDPIRRGRFWSIGSNTPWQGGKIDYYSPNWYRRLKSDYKFTDTMYGSEGEYWANHWMPTLTNPLAPIRHFITDTDHWENKHQDSRPYAVTGGIAELQMIPLVGPALDGTIGRILKPRDEHPGLERAHRKYLEEMNNYYNSQVDAATAGGYLQLMPAGGYRIMGTGGGYGSGGVGVGYGSGGSGGGIGGSKAMGDLTAINQGIASAAGGQAPSITSLDSLRNPDAVADLRDVGSGSSLASITEQSWYNIAEMAGIYGFSVNTMLGYDEANRSMTLDPSSRMLSYSRAWWDLEMGGLGGDVSEIGRRYNPRDKGNYYNPIRNTMPDWLPGAEYFVDFKHGDPYVKIKKGEMRLPGEAYETLNQLHPDAFGTYGAFDRFKILADVAPYSDNYKYYRRIVSQMNQEGMLTDSMKAEYAEVRDQVSDRKSKYRFFNKKFQNAEVDHQTVTITKVLDANTFLTKEHPHNPIRLAGVEIPESATEVRQWLSQYIYEGARVRIGVDADPLFRVRDDTMNTMHAVVYANNHGDGRFWYDSNKGQSVNALLARRDFNFGFGSENPVKVKDDGSATATAALYDGFDRKIGSAWETFWHDVIPKVPIVNVFADKFMQIKTPLEMYKQREVYGKSWQPWTDPIGGWIQPMIEKGMDLNPLVASAYGYGTGFLFGRGRNRKRMGRIGALAFGVMSSFRAIDEWVGDKTPGGENYAWIPERRRKEREIEEYFDIIKYMKYKGLYEKANKLAQEHEGIDLNKILSDSARRGDENKGARRYLETQKKWLAIEEKRGYADEEFLRERRQQIRDQLDEIEGDRGGMRIGPYAMQALQYRAEYESTLYGADPLGDMTKIYKALPAKDREFFTEFMNASPEERKEILRMVPQNQRRFYQARWGMEMDDKPSLRAYFATHNLPGANWEGWRADVSLKDIKVKVVQNEGLEATEFGLWKDDVKRAEQSGAPEIEPMRPSNFIDVARIEKVLRGAGLSDVDVVMHRQLGGNDKHSLGVTMNLIKDRSSEIAQEINGNLGSLV